MFTIENVFLEENCSDRVVWKCTLLGLYSFKSFRRGIVAHIHVILFWKLL